MIRMENVSKSYKNGVHALRDVNLYIGEGEFVYIIGPTGSGKSTLIGYGALYDALDGYFFSNMFVMQPMSPFVYYICGILLVSGVIVGIIGSFLAVSKYLRWKR